MQTVSVVLFVLLVVFAGIQACFAFVFARLLKSATQRDATSSYTPNVSILMSLRGADLELAANLEKLLTQDYPNYDVRVIVDSERDSAWRVVQDAARQSDTNLLHVTTLQTRRTTCGFQNSAFSQAVSDLEDSCEVVVLVDGDLTVHNSWLRELVAPLRDEQVGGAFGNRWFMPQDDGLGTWVRYLWNVAAIVPMYVFSIPWGGCLAIRRSALEESGLAAVWQKTMVHDAPTKSALSSLKLELTFVPTLMMVNTDRCDVEFAHDFIKRQMMWTRLYHPNFTPVFLHAAVTTLAIAATIALAAHAMLTQDLVLAAWSCGALVAYLATMLLLIQLIEEAVRHVLRLRGETYTRYPVLACLRLPFAIVLTQFVYCSSILLATFNRRVIWRGVTYRWQGPYDIEVIENAVYQGEQQSAKLAT